MVIYIIDLIKVPTGKKTHTSMVKYFWFYRFLCEFRFRSDGRVYLVSEDPGIPGSRDQAHQSGLQSVSNTHGVEKAKNIKKCCGSIHYDTYS